MPLYDIEHVTLLTDTEQESLARAFTEIHCQRFHTPSFFVNVRFSDVSNQPVFRGGLRRSYNRVILRCRVGENRTTEIYGQHCRDLIKAWDEILGADSSSDATSKSSGSADRTLRTVWVMGALTTALEMGIQRPQTGGEIRWLREHKPTFQRLAEEGDDEMRGLMEELGCKEYFAEV